MRRINENRSDADRKNGLTSFALLHPWRLQAAPCVCACSKKRLFNMTRFGCTIYLERLFTAAVFGFWTIKKRLFNIAPFGLAFDLKRLFIGAAFGFWTIKKRLFNMAPFSSTVRGCCTRIIRWCRRRESNSHKGLPRRILNPLRLPFRHFGTK